jgi:hypothetical protein
MQNAADHPPIILALFAAHVRWQKGFDFSPLLVVQPKQVASHHPTPAIKGGDQGITNRFVAQHIY